MARLAYVVAPLLWATLGSGLAQASSTPIRTVIVFDNSGSMKKNDPGRMSEAAARLYFELARPGDEVALVAFDERAKVVIPIGHRPSRDEVAKAMDGLRFTGPTTNIGAALEAAAEALGDHTPAGRKDRVLLITDGQVDLGASRAEQVKGEVARIAGPLAVSFRERDTPIYTIAFTHEADRELLEKVAVKSGGLHRYIESPGALHKAFTEMFVLAGDAESLPVEGGEVTFDESIGSAHMVLSKNHPDDHNKLVAPDEGEVSADHPREGVEWTSAPSHDVVRLTKPQPGHWGIEQPEGVEGAVAIVGESDLQFVVRVGPTPATVQDPVHLEAELVENGQRVVAFSRLKDLKVEAKVKDPSGHERTVELTAAEKERGLFVGEVENEAPGEYGVVVTIAGENLARERRVAYRVLPPCFSASFDAKTNEIAVEQGEVCPRYTAIEAAAIRKIKGQKSSRVELKADAHGGFGGKVEPVAGDAPGVVVVELVGRTSDGYPVQYRLPELPLPAAPKLAGSLFQALLMYADGPLFLLAAVAFFLMWRKQRAAALALADDPHHGEAKAPTHDGHAEASAPAPSASAASAPAAGNKLVLLAPEDQELLGQVGIGTSEDLAQLKAHLDAARAELVRLGAVTKSFEESVETLLIKQAEVATSVGGLGGSEGLAPEVKARVDVVLAGMRTMDDLLIQGSDKGAEIDKGLRELEGKLALLADGKAFEWKPRRPEVTEINTLLLAKAETQTEADLTKLREDAKAAQASRQEAAKAVTELNHQLEERTLALESMTQAKEAMAAEKREVAAKLDKMTEEFNRLFAATQGSQAGGAEAKKAD